MRVKTMKWIELFNDWIREVTKRITNIEQRIEKLEGDKDE